MATFFVTLHVIVVVLVTGPMVIAPLVAGRAIARRNPPLARTASNALLGFGVGSLVAAGLGALAVGASGTYDFGTPWVVIALTVYVLVLVLAVGYTVPATRRAARLIQNLATVRPVPADQSRRAVPATPPPLAGAPTDDDDGASTPALEADLRVKQRIDEIVSRISGSGLLIGLGVMLLVVLMVVKPFG